jgi:tetratricopeptide (TPR) repeat protein
VSAVDETAPLLEGAAEGDALAPGRVFGRYLIVDRVGSGGVGEVYAAYDPNLDRRIALKVLRASASDSDGPTTRRGGSESAPGWSRLVREAQALAKLSHPNVVTVHDVGVSEGRTFIAMELVDGVDLSAWLAQQPRPGWRATLRLLIEAGRGLAAAHAKQTIHRDFKPANVLVGNDRRVRVSDFGLARLLEPEGASQELSIATTEIAIDLDVTSATRTKHGAIVGTPYYLAPEQYAGAPASVQTDIYAYCLTLHEALYGERPFPMTTIAGLASAKMDGAPAAPSTTDVPRRIRSAVARGLAASPDDRWPSMSALLAELERDVSGGVRKFVPAMMVGSAALLVGTFALTDNDDACTGARRHLEGVWDDARRSSLHATFENSGLSFAEGSEPQVVAALDGYAEGWVEAHTRSCERTQLGEQSAERLDRSMACLDHELERMNALLDVIERGDAVAIERALPAVQELPAVSACLDETPDPAVPVEPALADAVAAERTRLAEIEALQHAGLYAEALPLAEVVAKQAATLDHPPLLAEAKLQLGDALKDMGKLDEAEAALEEAVWLAHGAGHGAVQADGAVALVYLVGGKGARPDEGLRWARYASAQIDKDGADPSKRSALANNRGLTLENTGDYDGAEAAFDEALALLDEAGLSNTPRAAATIDNMGVMLRKRGRYKESIATHERALELRKAAFGPEHPVVARSLSNLAAALSEDAQLDASEAIQRQVIEIRERAYGPVHPDLAIALNNLGAVKYQRGEYTEAEALLRRVHAIRSEVMPGHPSTTMALSSVALAVEAQGRLDEAEALYERVLDEQEHVTARDIGTTLNNLGNLYTMQRRLDDAVKVYRRALALYEEQMGPDHPEVGLVLTNLGNVYEEQGKLDDARALQERALAVREKALGPDHPDVAVSLVGLAGALQAANDPAKALPLLERALSIADKANAADGLRGMIEFELAQAIASTGGDQTRARELVQKARDRYAKLPAQAEDVAAMDEWLATE